MASHEYYDDDDTNIPDALLDINGEVVLAMCKHCGKAEGDLFPKKDCPVADDKYTALPFPLEAVVWEGEEWPDKRVSLSYVEEDRVTAYMISPRFPSDKDELLITKEIAMRCNQFPKLLERIKYLEGLIDDGVKSL